MMSFFLHTFPFLSRCIIRSKRHVTTCCALFSTLTSTVCVYGATPLYTHSQFAEGSDSQQEAEKREPNYQLIAEGEQIEEAALKQEKKITGPVINFNNVSIVEFLRFVSRLTGKNFIFDPEELQFPVTIISETPASLEDVMAALLQNLRIHDFELLEQGASFLIHRNKSIKSPTDLYREGGDIAQEPQLATRVFLVKYADIARAGSIIKTMTSPDAIVEVIEETKRVVVTDFATNIKKIAELIASFDSPSSGIEIGQYVIQNSTPASIISIAEQIMEPIVGTQPFNLVPHIASNSVFIISTPFFVEKALSVIQSIDTNESVSRVFAFDGLKFDSKQAQKTAEDLKRKQLLEDTKAGFTDEEINQLTDDDVKKILSEKGYTLDQVLKMNEEQIRRVLREAPGEQAQAIRTELRKKKLFESNLPIGRVESTKFLIHKLQYRKSMEVAKALRAIAASLSNGLGLKEQNSPQSELVVTLNSVSTIEENNSLVFSGTSSTLSKVKDLIGQVDIPVRQVFIEVLVLDTTIKNSLNFGIEWGGKFQRHNVAGELGLTTTNSVLRTALNGVTGPTTPTSMNPMPLSNGFSAGSIGRKIKFNGTGFISIGALINALRSDTDTNVIMNPRITTEHNVPAEIFVGEKIGIKGQSISNNNADIITTNFETRDTGITLRVTPLISAHQTVTLIIDQRISSASEDQVQAQGGQNAPPATITETRTSTRVHLPSGYFIVMSGMIREQRKVTKDQIPCLGALPLIGNLFSNNGNVNDTRNLMLFIRPHIIDTDLDIEEITRKQQKIFEDKSRPSRTSRTVMDDVRDITNFYRDE